MKQITHLEKVLWELYCNYTYIPKKKWFTWEQKWNDDLGRYATTGNKKWHTRRSEEQWDFIRSSYYKITVLEPIYGGTIENLISYFEPSSWRGDATVNKNPAYYKKKRWNSRHGRSWRRFKDGKSAFRKQDHHEKKVLADKELAKREWRESSGLNRERRKTHWKRGPSKWIKRHCNKIVRQYHREMIYQERWDELSNNDYKFILDPWMWD